MELHAEFTENVQATAPTPCERESCDIVIPPGGNRFYVHNKKYPDQPGRYICKKCYQYYYGHPNTVKRQEAATTTSQNGATQFRSQMDVNVIRRDVTVSHRQGAHHPLGRVTSLPANMGNGTGPRIVVPHVQQGSSVNQSMVIHPSPSQASLSTQNPGPPQIIGYSSAHLQHGQQVSEWAQRSYRTSGSGMLGVHLSQMVPLNIEVYEPELDAKGNPIRIPSLREGFSVLAGIIEPELAKSIFDSIVQPLISYCRQRGVSITPDVVNRMVIRESTPGKPWSRVNPNGPPSPYFGNRFMTAPRKKTDLVPIFRAPAKAQLFGIVLSEDVWAQLCAKQDAELMNQMNFFEANSNSKGVSSTHTRLSDPGSVSTTSWQSYQSAPSTLDKANQKKQPVPSRKRIPSPGPFNDSEDELPTSIIPPKKKRQSDLTVQLPISDIPPKKRRSDPIGTAARPIEVDHSDSEDGTAANPAQITKPASATASTHQKQDNNEISAKTSNARASFRKSHPRCSQGFIPLDANSISRAFQEGGAGLKKSDIKDVGQLISESILFFPLPRTTFPELSKNPRQLIFISIQPNGQHFHAHLAYNPDPKIRLGKGAFKTAIAAALEFDGTRKPSTGLGSVTINQSQSIDVALKRPFVDIDLSSVSGTRPGPKTRHGGSTKLQKKESRLSYPEEQQAISGEAKLLVWANALLEYAYDYIGDHIDTYFKNHTEESESLPPFIDDMPSFRFVEAAVAVATKDIEIGSSKKPSSHRAVYLLEEMLPGTRSDFVKYIHNAEAVSLIEPDEPDYHLAEFLVFIQHVQFQITHKQAYISDFQGVDTTLTDPQIMTAPHLGADLFGDGNVGQAFERFPQEHPCNKYCEWFGLDILKA